MILCESWIILSTAWTLASEVVCIVPAFEALSRQDEAVHTCQPLSWIPSWYNIEQLAIIPHLTHRHPDTVSGCCYPIYFHSILSISSHLNYSGGRSGGSNNSDCNANLLACLTTALPGCNWHNCQARVRKTKAIWMWRDKTVSLSRTGNLEAVPWMMHVSNGGGGGQGPEMGQMRRGWSCGGEGVSTGW